jgi:hypothetical protein
MGLFKPAWMSNNLKRKLKGIQRLEDQAILAEIAKNQDLQISLAAVERLTDQKLLAIVFKAGLNEVTRRLAATKLTDQAQLLEVARVITNWYGFESLLKKLLLFHIDELEWLRIVNSLKPLNLKNEGSKLAQEIFSQITTPSVLLAYNTMDRNEELDRIFLSRVIELSKENPEILRQFQSKAYHIIKNAHTDFTRDIKAPHQDAKQHVPGRSSDCYDDTVPWKPVTGYYGYHQDGYGPIKSKHEDINPFVSRFQPYWEEDDQVKEPAPPSKPSHAKPEGKWTYKHNGD